ncbi:MAG: hypothetical protein Q9157_006054 [Trypethelium eluteriae]
MTSELHSAPNLYNIPDGTSTNVPRTPPHKSHKEINDIVESLSTRYNIPLYRRDGPFSPSQRRRTDGDSCYNIIRILFFSNQAALDKVILDFEGSVFENGTVAGRLQHLTTLLRDQFWLEHERVPSRISVEERLNAAKIPKDSETPSVDAGSTSPGGLSVKVDPPTIYNERKHGNIIRDSTGRFAPQFSALPSSATGQGSPSRQKDLPQIEHKRVKSTDNSIPESLSDGDWSYDTAPEHAVESPTLMAQAQRQMRLGLQESGKARHSISSPFRTRVSSPTKADRKRLSDELSAESFETAPQSAKRNRSKEAMLYSSFTSEASTLRSTNGSFWSQAQDGQITGNTSFVAEPEIELEPSHITTLDQLDDEILSQPMEELHLGEAVVDVIRDADSHIHQLSQSAEAGTRTSEHYLVRDLPKHGLFCEEIPADIAPTNFFARYEVCRVAQHTAVAVPELLAGYDGNFDDYDALWSHLGTIAGSQKLPKRTDSTAWANAKARSPEVILTGSLFFNRKRRNSIFHLRLEPIQNEKSCRFQRAFRTDRFLYLNVPAVRQVPEGLSYLKGQEEALIGRYKQWLASEHEFLGRKWRVLMVETKQSKKIARQPNAKMGQRLILFATDGDDVQHLPNKYDLMNSLAAEKFEAQDLDRLINWFLPIKQNLDQPFCKAYTRLELVKFGIAKTRNLMERRKAWNSTTPLDWSMKLDSTLVMDDGCGAISLGAAQKMWQIMEMTDPLPSAIQARIGSAKGVWYISAPTDTTSSEHRKTWIEIKQSQLKFHPHDDDLVDKTCDRRRLAFEVLKYSKPLTSSTLNLAFIPILQDRGVSIDSIYRQVRDHLDFERENLLQALNGPTSLRRWINARYTLPEDNDRDNGLAWLGGLPFSLREKVIFLLEGGFEPLQNRCLAKATYRLVHTFSWKFIQGSSIPLGLSTNAIGIADPKDVLAPGEIHLAFSQDFHDEKSGQTLSFLNKKDVLVARHPCMRRSDIQKVRAVFKPELSHIRDVVIFSRKGQIPLAHKLQGGDYDGDTFWICWEPLLTQEFQNAPAPTNVPSPQSYRIRVDKTPLRAILNEADPEPLREFLKQSFHFRSQPDLLGVVTNDHQSLSYAENTIDSPGLTCYADMHDYLIDSAKNGYSYSFQDYRRFKADCKDIRIKSLPEPAYRKVTKAKMDTTTIRRGQSLIDPSIKHNPQHIVDKLVFQTIAPHIEETLRQVDARFADSPTSDPELTSLYEEYRSYAEDDSRLGDDSLRNELDDLVRRLVDLKNEFNSARDRKFDMDNIEQFEEHIQRFHNIYQNNIIPTTPSHLSRDMRRTLCRRKGPHEPTEWDLLKASALHAVCHKSYSFVFQTAGKELVELKSAASSSGRRNLVHSQWEMMKPRKAKKLETAAAIRDDDDDAKSEGMVENIADDME